MKKALIVALLFLCNYIYSVDFDTYFFMDNFHFNDDDELDTSEYFFEFGETITQEISNGLYLDAGFSKSIISDYSIFTDFRIANDFFGFNLGIFTNFLNDSSKLLTPGLNYGLDFIIPGILLLNLDLNNTIPNTSPLESGVNINNYNIKIGFYIGDAIISANLESENSTKGTILTSTSTINNKYFLNMDLFSKYSKYRISLDLGWNHLGRSTTYLTTEEVDSVDALVGESLLDKQAGSVYFKTNFDIKILESLSLDLGFLLHLIKIPLNELGTFETDEFSWGMNISVVYNL